jgi:hypothetical protein
MLGTLRSADWSRRCCHVSAVLCLDIPGAKFSSQSKNGMRDKTTKTFMVEARLLFVQAIEWRGNRCRSSGSCITRWSATATDLFSALAVASRRWRFRRLSTRCSRMGNDLDWSKLLDLGWLDGVCVVSFCSRSRTRGYCLWSELPRRHDSSSFCGEPCTSSRETQSSASNTLGTVSTL